LPYGEIGTPSLLHSQASIDGGSSRAAGTGVMATPDTAASYVPLVSSDPVAQAAAKEASMSQQRSSQPSLQLRRLSSDATAHAAEREAVPPKRHSVHSNQAVSPVLVAADTTPNQTSMQPANGSEEPMPRLIHLEDIMRGHSDAGYSIYEPHGSLPADDETLPSTIDIDDDSDADCPTLDELRRGSDDDSDDSDEEGPLTFDELRRKSRAPARRAHPAQMVVVEKPTGAFLKRRIESGATLTDAQRAAAIRHGLLPKAARFASVAHLVIGTADASPSHERKELARAARERAFAAAIDDKANDTADVVEIASGLASSSSDHSADRAQRAAEAADEAHRRAAALADAERHQYFIHLGSSRPHAVDGDSSIHRPTQRWAPAGSLRQLDVESDDVLLREPLPSCNIPVRSDPEDPPSQQPDAPGPFTTEELIPPGTFDRVVGHGRKVVELLRRAQRGDAGAHIARKLRPEALILSAEETLNPCGRGWVWKRRADEDLWDAVRPSSVDDPPDSSFKGEVFAADAERLGMLDQQLVSWGLHGFPGARGMAADRSVIGYPHAGGIKHAADLQAMNQRDIHNKFVSHGHSFPEIWPCIVDPMNIVIQHGKPRATIDKTIRLSSSSHPEPVAAYNDYIDLEDERKTAPFALVRVWMLSRAAAILATAGVTVKRGKFDMSTYFRIHGKQRAHIWQSGRLLETGYGVDYRVNFGERDAPDHTGRASNALAFFVRTELRRLGSVYPTRCPQIVKWLAIRTGLARENDDLDDPTFVWTALFFFLFYVDDAGLAAFCDPVFDAAGNPIMISIVNADGSTTVRQQTRDELYFEAGMAIVRRYGHLTPEKKQSPMGFRLDFLGILLDIAQRKRLLTDTKRKAYLDDVDAVIKLKRNPNGTIAVKIDTLNSLVHKLLHACEVVPIGRAHLHHLRAALREAKRAAANEWRPAFLGDKAVRELEWWRSQLHDVASCEQHGVPFAVRFGFPSSDPDTIVHYGDASREVGNLVESGFGAWSVIDGVFVYIEGRWTEEEILRFSINVLESFIKDVATFKFVEYARGRGLPATHSLAYTDNSTAEAIAENARASTDGLFTLNARRQQWLIDNSVHQLTDRVASIDNDIADLLSRGDLEEALRFPAAYDLPIVRLRLSAEERDLSFVPPTWAA
jgi:hypothetical protein